MDLISRIFGIRALEDVLRELKKEVTIIEYPKGIASPFLVSEKVKVVEGEPEKGWRNPYLKLRGEGSLDFFGYPRGVLLNGLAETLLYVSGTLKGLEAQLGGSSLRVYVYPGLPCYFVLREIGKLTAVKGLKIEVVSVDSDERHELLRRLGVNKVPTFELDGELLHTGQLKAEELYFLILKKIRARELSRERSA